MAGVALDKKFSVCCEEYLMWVIFIQSNCSTKIAGYFLRFFANTIILKTIPDMNDLCF